MKIKDTIFGSGPEERLFRSLESAWPDRIDLYPSLPFLSVIDTSGARLSPIEWQYLKNTSVDYTACDKSGRPLVSVEFDGLGHGYNGSQGYVELVPTGRDPNRAVKMDLKLRLASAVRYPFFVVSYDEARPIASDDLTITHAIVGRTLAAKNMNSTVQERFEHERDLIESLQGDDQNEFLQEMVSDAEVELSIEWDPLARENARAYGNVWRTEMVESLGSEFLSDPELPTGDPFEGVDVLRARIVAMSQARRVGVRCSIRAKDGTVVVREAWMRNITGVHAGGIAGNIAEMLACRAFVEKYAP